MKAMKFAIIFSIVALVSFQALASGAFPKRYRMFVQWIEPTLSVPEGTSKESLIKALRLALVMRTWKVTEHNQAEQQFDIELPIRSHVARLRIDYKDKNAIRFIYREGQELPIAWFVPIVSGYAGVSPGEELSRNEPESGGKMAVHQNYYDWVQELVRTVEGVLSL